MSKKRCWLFVLFVVIVFTAIASPMPMGYEVQSFVVENSETYLQFENDYDFKTKEERDFFVQKGYTIASLSINIEYMDEIEGTIGSGASTANLALGRDYVMSRTMFTLEMGNAPNGLNDDGDEVAMAVYWKDANELTLKRGDNDAVVAHIYINLIEFTAASGVIVAEYGPYAAATTVTVTSRAVANTIIMPSGCSISATKYMTDCYSVVYLTDATHVEVANAGSADYWSDTYFQQVYVPDSAVQRGKNSITTSVDITVSAVDTARTSTFAQITRQASALQGWDHLAAKAHFTDSTSLLYERAVDYAGSVVWWQLIQWPSGWFITEDVYETGMSSADTTEATTITEVVVANTVAWKSGAIAQYATGGVSSTKSVDAYGMVFIKTDITSTTVATSTRTSASETTSYYVHVLTPLINEAPVNDATPVCTNLDDTDNLYAQYKIYEFSVSTTDAQGYADIDYVELRSYDTGTTTLRWTVRYDEDTNLFTEQDGGAYISLSNPTYSKSGVNVDVTFKMYIEFAHPDATDDDLYQYVRDTAGLFDADSYNSNYDYETRIDFTSYSLSDGSGTVDRGNYDSLDTITASGTAIYYGSADNYPTTTYIDIWVLCTDVAGGPWSDLTLTSGAFSMTVDSDDVVGEDTYTFKAVLQGTGPSGVNQLHAAHEDTYIADRIQILTTVATDGRINYGTDSTTVNVTAQLEYDSHTLGSGDTLYMNDTSMTWDSDHFFITTGSYSIIDLINYFVNATNANEATYGITVINLNGQDADVIWDSLTITITGPTDQRNNINANATGIYVSAVYDYDSEPFDGTLTLNSTTFSYATAQKQGYTVSSASGDSFGITAISTNDNTYHIWDAIGVNMWISDGRDNIDDTITVYAWLTYLYDATNVTDGTVLLNGTGMSYSSQIWSLGRSQSTVGIWAYNITSISGNTHGITVIGWNEFNGADETDYVNAPDSVSLSITGSITVSAWIYIDGYDDAQPLYYVLSKGGDSWGSYHLRIYNATKLLAFTIGDPASQWGSDSVFLTEVLSTEEWHLITGVWDSDADELRIYWNGVLNNTDPTTYASIYDEDVYGLTLGCLQEHYYYFNGSIDSVRIYNRSLSTVEIYELYQCRYSDDTGLVFHVNMASWDVADNTWYDLSGEGNDATIYGPVISVWSTYHSDEDFIYVRPIWDRLVVSIQADDESPDTGDTVTFTITVTYEYDSSTCLTWTVDVQRDAAASWLSRTYPTTTFTDMESSPTSHDYLANVASDTTYLLSVFTTNTETVTWYNQYPVNVSLSVDYDDTDNWYARYRYYLITFTVSDGDGYGNIGTVQIALFESTRTTMYWAVNYTQATDTFTEAYGASKIVLAGWTYDSSAGNQIILYIYIKVEWSHGELTDADFRGYVIDDVAESDLDWYDENAEVICTLDYTVTPTVTDSIADGTRGDISGSLTGDGTVIYYGSGDNYPLANETDVWILHDVSGTWSDDVDGSGAFSRAMTAESSVRLSTYSIKVVISGAGSGGTDLYYTTTITDTYISDAIGAYLWINDGRDDIDDTITVYAWLTYVYDRTNVTGGTVLLNGSAMSYASNIWSLGRSQSTVGLWAYNITSISGNTYGITAIASHFFDGDGNDYVGIAASVDFDGIPEMTVAAWVNPSLIVGDYRTIFGFTGAYHARNWELAITPTGEVYFHITNGTHSDGLAYGSVPLDTWSFISARYSEGELIAISLNGVVLYSRTPTIDMTYLAYQLSLGAYSYGQYDWFNGYIDEVRLYNRSLSDVEIFELYQKRYSNDTGLVLHLNMASLDCSDGTWYDSSNNGHDGTVYGSTTNETVGSNYVRPIWDSLTITITGPTDQRNNINANATGIYVSAVYDYDSEPFDGTLTLNSTTFSYATAQKQGYTVTSVSGDSYGITIISVNDDTYHIWDSLTITITGPTDQRNNINANATGIYVSAVYDYDSEPYDGTFTMNNTDYDGDGTVVKWGYTVTSASGDSFGITAISMNDDTYHIWDSLTITITGPTDQRCDLNANATGIYVSAVYDYDSEPFDGTLTLNDTTYSYATVGKRGYTVATPSGDTHGITAISTNDDTYCIWDEMLVLYILADEDVTNFGQSVNFTVGLQYKYDSDNVQTGTFSLEALALAFSSGANWTVSDSHSASGSWLYNDVTGTDGAYSLTGIDMDGNSITVVWDIIVISASLNYDWTIIGYNLTITTTGTFEHLGYTWNGTPTWSGTDYPEENTIGNYSYTLTSITEPDYGVTTFTNDPTLWAVFDTVNCSSSALYWLNTLDADWLYLDTGAFFFGFNGSALTENFKIQSYYGYPDASTSSDYAYVNDHSQIDRLIIGNFSGAGMDTINASYSAVCTILGEPEYRIWSYDMSYLDVRNVVYEDTVFVDAGARAYILNNEEVRNEIRIVLYNNSMIAGSYAEDGTSIWVRILAYREDTFPTKEQIWSSTKSLSTNMGGTVVWSLRNWDAWNICNKWNTATSPFIYIYYSTVSSGGPWTFINAFHALGSNYNLDPYSDATWTVDLERSQVLVESDWSPDRENLTAWMEADGLTPYGYGEFAQYEWVNAENWNRYVWEASVTIWADFGAPITGPAPLGSPQFILAGGIMAPLAGWQEASGVDDISYFWLDVFPQWAFWYEEYGQWYQTGNYDISLWLRTRLENNILWSPWYGKLADPNNYETGQHFQENLIQPFDYRNTELSIAGERIALSGDITFSFDYTIYENEVNVGSGSVNITPTLNVWSQFAIYWDRQQGTGNVNYSIYCDTTAYEDWSAQSLWINGTYSKAEPPSGFTIEQFEVEYDDVYINIYCETNWANSTLYLYVDDSLKTTSAEADIIQYRKSMTEGTHTLDILIDAGSQTRWRNYTYAIGVDAITLKIMEFEWDTGSPNTYSCFVRTNWGNATVRLLEDGNTRFIQTEVGKGMSFKLSKVQRIGVHTVTLQIDAGGQILTYILGYSYREPDHPSDTPDVGPMLSVIGDELSDATEGKVVLHPALIGFFVATAFMAVIIIIIVFKWLLKEPIL